jgi:hypothetical protein
MSSEEYYLSPMINAMCCPDDTFKSNTSLGNVLFKLASSYSISKRTGRKLSNYYIKEFCERLKRVCNYNHGDTIFRFFLTNEIPCVSPTITIEQKEIYDTAMINDIGASKEHCIAIGNNSLLGWPIYFSDCRDDILNIFSIPEDIISSFKEKYKELFDSSVTPVSIHMRLNRSSVPVDEGVEADYYTQAVLYINANVTNPVFFLCSDNITRAKENISKTGAGKVIYVTNEFDYLDLYLISLCHNHIMSASTFSWWGAYLSTHESKIVTYPKYFYNYMKFTGFSHETFNKMYSLENAICI